jgi:hypothetical protein
MLFILLLNDHRKQVGFMAEYRPCPWCGVDVTPTAPPPKIAPGVGSVAQSSRLACSGTEMVASTPKKAVQP